MRLPWLQVNADGLTRARLLAKLLGVPETQGAGMALALWAWALEMSPEGDFSGVVIGDPELLAAACGWPPDDASRLVAQLQRVGFIATAPALRVRGLDRYRRTWEKNQKRFVKPATFGDRVPETGATRAGLAPEPARKTETETETDKRQKLSRAKKPREVDPRHAPLVFELVEIFREVTGASYPFAANGGRNAKAVADLLAAEPVPERISTVWRQALRATGYPLVRTLPELATHFAHFIGAQPAKSGGLYVAPLDGDRPSGLVDLSQYMPKDP